MQELSQCFKRTNANFFLLALLVTIFTGCAASPSSASKEPSLDDVLKQAALKIEEHLDKGTKVALINIQSPTTRFSDYVLTYLESVLVNNGKLIIVDRANLDKIRQEQGFQMSGDVSDESAKAIGKMLGAGVIVTGAIINIGDSYRLTLKAINVDTATVAASYPADIAKNERVRTLLASSNTATSSSDILVLTVVNNTGYAINKIGIYMTGDKADSKSLSVNINDKATNKFSLPPVDSSKKYSLMVMTVDGSTYVKDNLSIKSDITVTFNQSDKYAPPAKTATTSSTVSASSYKIGDTGPAGGLVFYDKGNSRDGWRYLEAAPASTEKTATITNNADNDVVGSRKIGDGKDNTQKFMKVFEKKGGGINTAPWLCNDLNINGFNDWYLPSLDELLSMYNNLYSKGLGGFKGTKYWSSYVNGWWKVFAVDFSDGSEKDVSTLFDTKCQVRAIRQF